MEKEINEWVCSCGQHNTGNFCAACGKKRENGPDDLQATQVMRPVQPPAAVNPPSPPAAVQPVVMQPPVPPIPPNAPVLGTVPARNRTTPILIGIAVVLLLAVVGLYAYISGSDERYIAKCEEAQKIVLDTQSTVKDIKDLKGDPDADETKSYLERLKTAEDNIGKIQKDLASMHVSEKYKAVNQTLGDALTQEQTILKDTENVLKTPLADDSAAAVKRVRDNTAALASSAGSIKMEHIDFAMAMQLGSLADDLDKYIAKKRDLDAARRAEQLRQEQAAREARAAAFRNQLNDKNQRLISTTTDLEWITTNVRRQGTTAVLEGYFYNGTRNPIIKLTSMQLSGTFTSNGQNAGSFSKVDFSNLSMKGRLMPGGRCSYTLTVPNANLDDFDEFDVTASNLRWVYVY